MHQSSERRSEQHHKMAVHGITCLIQDIAKSRGLQRAEALAMRDKSSDRTGSAASVATFFCEINASRSLRQVCFVLEAVCKLNTASS